MTIDEIMRTAPVIPVLVLDDALDPVALAETLVRGGLPVIEVTLRTPGALDAIRAMANVPGAIVGAGTVLDEAQLAAVEAASAAMLGELLHRPTVEIRRGGADAATVRRLFGIDP